MVSSQRLPAAILLAVFFWAAAGCGNYHLLQPTVVERAQWEVDENAARRHGLSRAQYTITDKHILDFCNSMKTLMRRKTSYARVSRYASSTIQIFSAAAAASLTAAGGPADLIAALAGSSAVMPHLQDIFESDKRAQFYVGAVGAIEEAEQRYLAEAARSGAPGQVPSDKLTVRGAELYLQVVQTLKNVEKAIVGLLPTSEEMARAEGKVRGDGTELELTFKDMTVQPGDEFVLGVMNYDPKMKLDYVSISSPSVVANLGWTEDAQEKTAVRLRAITNGVATVVVVDDRGRDGRTIVTVANPFNRDEAITYIKSWFSPNSNLKDEFRDKYAAWISETFKGRPGAAEVAKADTPAGRDAALSVLLPQLGDGDLKRILSMAGPIAVKAAAPPALPAPSS